MSNFFQFLLQTNTINFLIVLLIVVFLIKKLNINSKIETLQNEIKSYVNSSEQEKKQAETELSRINDKISKLPAVVERIKRSTDNNIKNIEANTNKNIEIQKEDIYKTSRRIFNLETKKFKSKLTNLLSEKSVEIAKENAINQLKNNPDLHNRYIDKAIEEIDRISL